MAHITPSSPRSSSAGHEGRQLAATTLAFIKGQPMSTSTPAHANMSMAFRRVFPNAMSTILKAATSPEAPRRRVGGLDAALAAFHEKLGSPEVSEQVGKLTSSESVDDRNEIASKLADMLTEGDTNLTEQLTAYNVNLPEVIKLATETVEKSPEFSRYLRKAPSESSADSDSPDRLRQASHRFDRPRHRSLSSSSKSDVFTGRMQPLAIDAGKQNKELREQLSQLKAEKEELSWLYQQSQNTLAEKRGLEAAWEERKAAWERERETWAKTEKRLEQHADGYKQDKDGYKQDKEKWEILYAEDKVRWQERYDEDKVKWQNRYDEDKAEWRERHAIDKAEKEKQDRRHHVDIQKWEKLHAEEKTQREKLYRTDMQNWENRYHEEVLKREALEEELRRLRPNA